MSMIIFSIVFSINGTSYETDYFVIPRLVKFLFSENVLLLFFFYFSLINYHPLFSFIDFSSSVRQCRHRHRRAIAQLFAPRSNLKGNRTEFIHQFSSECSLFKDCISHCSFQWMIKHSAVLMSVKPEEKSTCSCFSVFKK